MSWTTSTCCGFVTWNQMQCLNRFLVLMYVMVHLSTNWSFIKAVNSNLCLDINVDVLCHNMVTVWNLGKLAAPGISLGIFVQIGWAIDGTCWISGQSMHLAWMHSITAYIGNQQDGLLHGLGPLSPRPRWGWSRREAAQGKSLGVCS